MNKCKKCKSADIKEQYQPKGKKIYWCEHNEIKKLSKFTKSDKNYSVDRIKEPCVIYTCETCGYKVAKKLEK